MRRIRAVIVDAVGAGLLAAAGAGCGPGTVTQAESTTS